MPEAVTGVLQKKEKAVMVETKAKADEQFLAAVGVV